MKLSYWQQRAELRRLREQARAVRRREAQVTLRRYHLESKIISLQRRLALD